MHIHTHASTSCNACHCMHAHTHTLALAVMHATAKEELSLWQSSLLEVSVTNILTVHCPIRSVKIAKLITAIVSPSKPTICSFIWIQTEQNCSQKRMLLWHQNFQVTSYSDAWIHVNVRLGWKDVCCNIAFAFLINVISSLAATNVVCSLTWDYITTNKTPFYRPCVLTS